MLKAANLAMPALLGLNCVLPLSRQFYGMKVVFSSHSFSRHILMDIKMYNFICCFKKIEV